MLRVTGCCGASSGRGGGLNEQFVVINFWDGFRAVRLLVVRVEETSVKYVSIDIETTGLDPATCDIIEFAAVVADTTQDTPVDELPYFHTYILLETYVGEPYGLSMHPETFRRIAEREKPYAYTRPCDVTPAFKVFLERCGLPDRVWAAGKNVGSFDLPFIKFAIPGLYSLFRHRVLDPGILYFNPATDKEVPNLATCLVRSGSTHLVGHTALADARAVVAVLQHKFRQEREVNEANPN